jgi:hypothetical protein
MILQKSGRRRIGREKRMKQGGGRIRRRIRIIGPSHEAHADPKGENQKPTRGSPRAHPGNAIIFPFQSDSNRFRVFLH